MRSERQLCDTLQEMLREVFSVRSVPRCYKRDKSIVELVVRQSTASKEVNTEVEESVVLKAVTR
jgi:hypothetical protein